MQKEFQLTTEFEKKKSNMKKGTSAVKTGAKRLSAQDEHHYRCVSNRLPFRLLLHVVRRVLLAAMISALSHEPCLSRYLGGGSFSSFLAGRAQLFADAHKLVMDASRDLCTGEDQPEREPKSATTTGARAGGSATFLYAHLESTASRINQRTTGMLRTAGKRSKSQGDTPARLRFARPMHVGNAVDRFLGRWCGIEDGSTSRLRHEA